MAEHGPGDQGAEGRFVRLDDGDLNVVQDGTPGAPALLLIHGTAGSTRLLWRLRTENTIRKAMRTGFTRPVEITGALVEGALGMTHRAFAGTDRAARDYLGQRSLPARLATLGLPLLVIFGTEDARYPSSSSAAAYRAVPGARVELLPGVGHTPMPEDPQATAALLLEFAQAAARSH